MVSGRRAKKTNWLFEEFCNKAKIQFSTKNGRLFWNLPKNSASNGEREEGGKRPNWLFEGFCHKAKIYFSTKNGRLFQILPNQSIISGWAEDWIFWWVKGGEEVKRINITSRGMKKHWIVYFWRDSGPFLRTRRNSMGLLPSTILGHSGPGHRRTVTAGIY